MKRPVLLTILCSLLSACLSGCGDPQPHPARSPTEHDLPTLRLATERLADDYQTVGSVVSDERVEISSRLAAYVRAISVREGERVRRGQVLVQLESINDGLENIAAAMKTGVASMGGPHEAAPTTVNVVSKVPAALVGVMSEQFKLMQGWLAPIFKETREQTEEMKKLKVLMDQNLERYQVLLDELQEKGS